MQVFKVKDDRGNAVWINPALVTHMKEDVEAGKKVIYFNVPGSYKIIVPGKLNDLRSKLHDKL